MELYPITLQCRGKSGARRLLLLGLSLLCGVLLFGCASGKKQLMVGEDVREEDFREFYYTESSTVNPPEFQRYYFYLEDGKPMFYHEKREGDTVFLTEEDITVHGTKALTEEEWQTFWDFLCMGSVQKREEDVSDGGSGPWLYLYLDGKSGDYQEFQFTKPGTVLSFEEFCIGLKDAQLAGAQENAQTVS